MADYYTAQQASQRLGVTRQTLYAYVSRGLLRAHASDTIRERRYLAQEVERLATRQAHARNPGHAAKQALDWGLPVVESSICTIQSQHLYYRGQDAVHLASANNFETVAAMLWQAAMEDAFTTGRGSAPARRNPGPASLASMPLVTRFALAGHALQSDAWQTDAQLAAHSYGDLVRTLASSVLASPFSTAPIRDQCAHAWSLNPHQARLVEQALILCADHELNASSFTVRCVASTGASLHACVLAGLAALSGPRHGGMTYRVESLWDEVGDSRQPDSVLRARLERGDTLPGFGHPLYPDGDVRAVAILNGLDTKRARWRAIAEAARNLTGMRPSLDFALVALRRQLGLPSGAALGLFALGRSVGWIAHTLEQRALGTLIRPRATYIGPPPQAAQPASGGRRTRRAALA